MALLHAGPALGQPPATIKQLGLTGPGYAFGPASGFSEYSVPTAINDAGQVVGTTSRSVNSLGDLGADGWLYNGQTTIQIGLTGTGYSYSTASGTFQSTDVYLINDAGEAAGQTERFSISGTSLGNDSWLYNGSTTVEVGLSGGDFGYSLDGGTFEDDLIAGLSDAGTVSGVSKYYDSSGDFLGADIWVSNGSSSQAIGLTGPQYSVTGSQGASHVDKFTLPQPMNSIGDVVGETARYGTNGGMLDYDQWIYNGTSTQLIGLTGGLYSTPVTGGNFSNNTVMQLSPTGEVIGTASRFSGNASLGTDSWIFNGTTTVEIGLTGANYTYTNSSGLHEYSTPGFIDASGGVAGGADRFSANGTGLGEDAWYYNGSSSEVIGLTDAAHSEVTSNGIEDASIPTALNNAGDVAGYSDRFGPGQGLGQDSWYFNGSTTQQIGITVAQDTFAGYPVTGGTYQSSQPERINDTGDVAGISDRYTSAGASLGQDAWLFDPSLDQTFLLQFSVDSATDASTTTPLVLTDSGAVIGTYELYSGSVDDGIHLFYWNENSGFADLGSLVNGGLSAAGWQLLDDTGSYPKIPGSDVGNPLYVVGSGLLSGQSSGESPFLMSISVPEPGSALIILLAALAILVRRRKFETRLS